MLQRCSGATSLSESMNTVGTTFCTRYSIRAPHIDLKHCLFIIRKHVLLFVRKRV